VAGNETHSDRQLVAKVIDGDKTAFDNLVRPQIGRLIALAKRMLGSASEAEDAVQDTLASVWLARHRLDPDRAIAPFMTTIVLNKCRDRLRRRKAASFIGIRPQLDEPALSDQAPNPEEHAAGREALARLLREIERLPIRLREALVLVAIDGRSQEEAATLLCVTKKAIEARVYRARKQLREKIDEF
jgi:RNA polymerase sigma-70 factor (ECF subfamily)